MPEQAAKTFGARQVPPEVTAYSSRPPARDAWSREQLIEPRADEAIAPVDIPLEPERRAGNRVRRLLTAKIIFAQGDLVADCVLRNISPTGARVEISGELALPEFFRIVRVKERLLNDARMVWRRGREMGISWTSEAVNILESGDPAHRRLARQLGFQIAGAVETSHFPVTSLD